MRRMTLNNDYHRTSVVVLVPDHVGTQAEAYEDIERAAAMQRPGGESKLRRVRKALCGISGCQCGTVRP